jgi:hypothetical protein
MRAVAGGRVSFDRAVSREPLAVAADAARMYFEWRFGTFVLSAGGVPIMAKQKPASHGGDDTPTTGCAATVTNTGLATCVREASAAPAAYLRRSWIRLLPGIQARSSLTQTNTALIELVSCDATRDAETASPRVRGPGQFGCVVPIAHIGSSAAVPAEDKLLFKSFKRPAIQAVRLNGSCDSKFSER